MGHAAGLSCSTCPCFLPAQAVEGSVCVHHCPLPGATEGGQEGAHGWDALHLAFLLPPSLAERLGKRCLSCTLLAAARSGAAWRKGCLWGRPTSSSVLFCHEDVLVLQKHQEPRCGFRPNQRHLNRLRYQNTSPVTTFLACRRDRAPHQQPEKCWGTALAPSLPWGLTAQGAGGRRLCRAGGNDAAAAAEERRAPQQPWPPPARSTPGLSEVAIVPEGPHRWA